ncbi:hypothetical protein THAOC_18567, partial [Thalassiosira oceanica]
LAQPAVRRVQRELVADGARPLPPLLVGGRPDGGQVLVVEEVGRVVGERVGEEEARRVREVAQVQRPAVPGADHGHGDYGHASSGVWAGRAFVTLQSSDVRQRPSMERGSRKPPGTTTKSTAQADTGGSRNEISRPRVKPSRLASNCALAQPLSAFACE